MGRDLLQRLEEVIEANYDNPSFGAKELAWEMGMSQSGLLKKLKTANGKSINQLIREYRLRKARETLQTEDWTISEVASRTGFRSASYFSTIFKKHFGYLPGDVLAGHQKNIVAKTGTIKSPGSIAYKHRKRSNHSENPRFRIALIALIIIAFTSFFFLSSTGRLRQTKTIAVLPLRNNGLDSLSGILSDVFREQMILALSRVKSFDVRSSNSSGIYRNTIKSMPRIGRELNVKYVIEGSCDYQDDRIKLTIQPIEALTDKHIGAMDYIFSPGDIYSQLAEIAENVSYKLHTRILPREKSAILQMSTRNQDALMQYMQGVFWFNEESPVQTDYSLDAFNNSIEADPLWAEPYLGKARTLFIKFRFANNMDFLDEGFMAASTAHRLRPGPDTYLALSRYYRLLLDLKTASKLLKKALKENPDDPDVNLFMGKVCHMQGKLRLSLKHLNRAIENYPEWQQAEAYMTRARLYERLRDYPRALSSIQASRSIDPDKSGVFFSSYILTAKLSGNTEDAGDFINELLEIKKPTRDPDMETYIAYYKVMNNIYSKDYHEALNELSHWHYDATRGIGHYPFFFRPKQLLSGLIHGYLGEADLERAHIDSARQYILEQLKEFPLYERYPKIHSCLAVTWAKLGNRGKAIETAEKVKSLIKGYPAGFSSTQAMEDIAWMHTVLGDYREACKILKKLLKRPGFLTTKLLELDPKWKPLHDLAEYQKLIKKFSMDR